MNKPNFSYPPVFDGLPAKTAVEKENEDLRRQITRIETRLVKLMNHMGIDTFGNEI